MKKLESVIPIGKENAIHQKDLAKVLGVTPAIAKSMVREARQNGLEILSSNCGYYFASNNEERKEFIALLSKQAYTRLKTTKPIKSTLEEISGQISLLDALNGASEEVQQ